MSRYTLRRYARRDGNEAVIVKAVRAAGASWLPLSVRDGPDGVLGWRGVNHLVEIKTATGEHKEGQEDFAATWKGAPIRVVRSVAEALSILGVAFNE